jgi:hypothetical protein
LRSSSSARYEPSCPLTPVINAVFIGQEHKPHRISPFRRLSDAHHHFSPHRKVEIVWNRTS